MSRQLKRFCLRFVASTVLMATSPSSAESVARIWNEQNLDAIRIDFPHPPVHARNLFHTSAAMWDAWAAYDDVALGYLHRETASIPDDLAADLKSAREAAISYAAYRVLAARYAQSVNAAASLAAFREQMLELGLDPDDTSTEGTSPRAVGNRVAQTILTFSVSDGSREEEAYEDPTYGPVNQPLIILRAGTTMNDPNRWQPLAFDVSFTQNGLVADQVQTFLGSHWGEVRPFALTRSPGQIVYHDPGVPPQLGNPSSPDPFREGNLVVIEASRDLDPDSGVLINLSPSSRGNNTLGENDGTGHEVNPTTGNPYEDHIVPLGDFGRVVAEFWADGPDSETPPGHWNTLANEVSEHPLATRQMEGEGPELDALEWDVKMYFALNAATHDVAVAVWGCKRHYDYVRPISSIRYMAGLGQSTEPQSPDYHPRGLPLQPGLVERVTTETAAPGERHEDLTEGAIAINAWGGEPDDPATQYTGTKWIRGIDWFPYQRDTFVTPAFAGYVSGHSGFSRAAAEILTAMTGDPYFPGGVALFEAPQDGFLKFEKGPSVDVTLQWATYYDAADEAGISRIYGGIHVPVDDGPGRIMGAKCGLDAWALAKQYFDGSIGDGEMPLITYNELGEGRYRLRSPAVRGLLYVLESSTDLDSFEAVDGTVIQATDNHIEAVVEPVVDDAIFYRFTRLAQ